MITILAAEIFIKAAVLCFLLYAIARHEADYGFAKVSMVTGGMVLGTTMIEAFLSHSIGWMTVFPCLAFIAFMLMTFCWITLWKSMLVVLLFTGIHVLMAMGTAALQASLTRGVATAMPVGQDDYELAREFHEQVSATLSGQKPAVNSRSETDVSASAPDPSSAASAPVTDAADREVALKLQPPSARSRELWTDARRLVRISGIVRQQGRALAYINGQLCEDGDHVTVTHKGERYRWRVAGISRMKVHLEPEAIIP